MAAFQLNISIETLDQVNNGLDTWIERLREEPLTTTQMAENFLAHAAPEGLGGCPDGGVALYATLMLATAMQRLSGPELDLTKIPQ